MKHIGIAAVTAEGAALCYKEIVSQAGKILGENIHPEISLHTFSHDKITQKEKIKDYKGVAIVLNNSIKKLALIGADFIIIPSNAAHYAIKQTQMMSPLPILSIVNVTVNECQKMGFKKVGVLGIEETMSGNLYINPLKKVSINPVVPTKKEQAIVNTVLWENVIPGNPTIETTKKVLGVIQKLKERGCDSVILGCTELPIIITKENSPLPFIDTTRLLARKALEYAIKE